jgi:hypothetical protein
MASRRRALKDVSRIIGAQFRRDFANRRQFGFERAPRAATGTRRPAGSLSLAQQQANGGLILWRLHLRINGGRVEVELASKFWPERCGLEFDDLQPYLF